MSHNSADKFSKLDVGEDHMNFIREWDVNRNLMRVLQLNN